jgi:hypothetical protein
MTYRKKSCPVCETEHKQRGPYCGKSCSNKARIVTKKTRAKMSESQAIRATTHEAEESGWSFRETGKRKLLARNAKVSADDFEMNPENVYLPPMKDNTPNGSFVADGDVWHNAED